jgi:hypothetical protein
VYVALGLGDSAALRKSRHFATAVRLVLYSLVAVNRAYVKANPGCPMLYDSGVRYRNETPAYITTFESQQRKRIERFDDIPTCLARMWADCDDLSPWRVAELRERTGEPATLRLTWKKIAGQKVFHVQVRRAPTKGPNGELIEGIIEDPSLHLGMGAGPKGDAL